MINRSHSSYGSLSFHSSRVMFTVFLVTNNNLCFKVNIFMKLIYYHQSAIFKPHTSRLNEVSFATFLRVYRRPALLENVWNIFTHLHSCHSKTLSCEQPAASHYAKSNKTVELSLVSQSNISKYSLTTHIGEDLEVCLCLDIKTTKTTVWATTGMRYLVCRGNRTNNFLSLKSTKSGRIRESALVWALTEMSICVYVCIITHASCV